MFGYLFFVFRSLVSLILGLLIFFGLLGFLLSQTLHGNLLTSESYTDSLSKHNVYDRVYDEVLLDPEFEETTDDLLGDIDVPQEDIAALAREIVTPQYLQDQVEAAIRDAIAYLNKETDVPEVFIELGPPLERTKPALLSYIDRRIDKLEDVPVTTMGELQAEMESLYRTLEEGTIPTRVPLIEDPQLLVQKYVDESIARLEEVPVKSDQELRREVEGIYLKLAKGELPNRVPSIESIPVKLRLSTYDRVFEALRKDHSIPEETLNRLEEQEDEIKEQLRKGSVKGALKIAAPQLTMPIVDKFVDDAYDRVFQKLSKDKAFPQSALDGLDQNSAAIKAHLGDGEIKESLKLGARGLVGPLIDQALQELREDLDSLDRLDIVAKAAEQNDQTVEQFLDDLDTSRDLIDVAADRWIALLVVVLGVILMAAVHLPRLSSAIRWPGLTLLLSGVVFLVLTLITKSQLPDDLLDRASASPIPPSMADIINDVSSSMASDIAGGLITLSIAIIAIGFAMLAGSYFLRLLHIPFFSR